ncbi:MAG: redoxin domain-containing protein [Xanthomonadales bacterium]|nr:redoxin domain-containing protein [Xanthomonadales bacterium]
MRRLTIVTVSLLALIAGFYLSARLNTSPLPIPEAPGKQSLVGHQQPAFELLSNLGEPVSNATFTGKTTLYNFWATWCVPCREEMPMLMELHSEYAARGFQVVGIALDELEPVNRFIKEINISYPILVGEVDVMATNADFGNISGVLPYSVLVDKNGIIRWQYAGEVDRDEISTLISSLL